MANKIKVERMNALIQRELSLILRDEVKDPAVKTVTITAVECTNDLSIAKVYVSFMEHNKRSMQALERSKGFIRSKLSKILPIRKCPEIQFVEDKSIAYGNHIDELLAQLHKKD